MRGAGLASVRWPFSGAIAGAIVGRFKRHCWLADCHYHLFEYETEIIF